MKLNKKLNIISLLLAVVLLSIALVACSECEHEFTVKEVINPTCLADGKQILACSKCDATTNVPLSSTGEHTFGEVKMVKAPGFSTVGEQQSVCTGCGAIKSEAIPAFGSYSDIMVSKSHTDIVLSNYKIVHENKATGYPSVEHALLLASTINELTGIKIAAEKQSYVPYDKDSYEILVGDTGRAESSLILNEIEGDGFAIRVIGNKIVIVGSNDLQTSTAVQYFINNYLPSVSKDGKITLCDSTTAYNAPAVTLMDSNGTDISFVYSHTLDTNKHHEYNVWQMGDIMVSYPVQIAESFQKTFASLAKIDTTSFGIHDDLTTSEFELIIGATNREDEISFRASLDADEYGILVTEGNIIITAHSDYALDKAMARFKKLMVASRTSTGNKNYEWKLPVGFCIIESANENWKTDFLRPDGHDISLTNAMSLGHDTLQFLYSGSGVTTEAYEAYCNKLIESGFSVYYKSDIEGSIFTTLTNDEMMLYIAYNAFAHADEPHNTDDSIHATMKKNDDPKDPYVATYPYLDYEPIIRVISSPIEISYLPEKEYFTAKDYEKVTESSITQVRLDNIDIGMCYIVTLEDGTFVIVDGGWNRATAVSDIWTALNSVYKNVWGKEPTKEQPIHIRAWYVTHSHSDHIMGFQDLYGQYKDTGLIVVDELIGNFPDKSSLLNGAYDVLWANDNLSYLTDDLDLDYNKVFAGQTLHFANLEMEVLMTFSDHAPRAIDNANDTNTVIKFIIHHKDAPDVTNTMLVLGDSMLYSSRHLCAMYGDYLKSDTVQLAHHGNVGCDQAVYTLSQPTAIWYPHHSGGYNSYVDASKASIWPYSVTDYVARKLDSVKYIYVAGIPGRAGTEALTLPCNADGTLNYEGIYNPITGNAVEYNDRTITVGITPALKLR